ncbi:MAG TPA: HypC/HybG/HupF family hydrogenase formation chaperone [Terracidiphilus sp.]|jgi:hydrogenase expression/formation protein HypC|nr:HypC/HybG/HupF family hydrogenase formation chaperone [Terracidiphilus sp.]
MCLAIPGKVEEILNEGDLRVGRVNFGGVVKRVCLDYVPEIQVGDYTIVHVGFALSKIDEETAEKTLADFRALGVLEEELADEQEQFARAAKAPQMFCPDGSCAEETASSAVGRKAN